MLDSSFICFSAYFFILFYFMAANLTILALQSAALIGDFNNWNAKADVMTCVSFSSLFQYFILHVRNRPFSSTIGENSFFFLNTHIP